MLMSNVALPVLKSVTVCAVLVDCNAWPVNVKLCGERLAVGAVVPVPVSEIVWGLLPALSIKISEPSALPATVGVKVTLMVQILWGATKLQVLVCAKGAAVEMALKLSGALPLLVTVTVCTALVVFTSWVPKPMVLAESETAGAPSPVPSRGTIWELVDVPLLLSVTASVP